MKDFVGVVEEVTFELTNFCPFNCNYCSSKSVSSFRDENIKFISIGRIREELSGKRYKHIILSGGEPLSHPNFYNIYMLCKDHSEDVVVYSNLITHRIYNANVIDGVYLEANLTLIPETRKIHILKRVCQGRESQRPEVHFSRNYTENCSCNHRIVRPDGRTYKNPCKKYDKP